MSEEPINLLNNNQELEPELPSGGGRKALSLFIIVLVGAGLFLGLRHMTAAHWSSNPDDYDSVTLQPKKKGILQSFRNLIFKPDAVLDGQDEDRVNILVLGIGGAGHDGPFLSDTNIVVSIKPSTKEVALISIPRDLAVNIPGHGIRKINSADSFGEADNPGNGGDYARSIFSSTLNIKIPYYVRIDFKAFEDLINAVGGLSVNVPRSFVDREFPGANFATRTIQFDAGTQMMDGATALDFARSRHGNNGEGSDFARARRQQIIISALKEKLLSLGTYTNPLKIQAMLSALTTHVTTNLDFGQLMYLANFGKDVTTQPHSLVLDEAESGFLKSYIAETGAYLLGPKTGNFSDITLAIEHIFDTTTTLPIAPAQNHETVSVAPTNTPAVKPAFLPITTEIQNGTWQAGLAARVRKDLQDKGFTIGAIGNAVRRPQPKTMVYVLNTKADQKTVLAIAQALHTTATSVIPEWLDVNYDNAATVTNEAGMQKFAPNDDILIVLGEDYSDK